jgi:branched-chain amino acid transport system ATP-binding protein
MSNDQTLVFDQVSASYGPFKALFDVSFSVGRGEAVALLGSNGSGKTSVARVASGLIAPTDGTVYVSGESMKKKRAFKFAQAGVYHAPEGRSVFATLTVEENILISGDKAVAKETERLERAFTLFPRLAERRYQVAGTLSGGEQRMLALAGVIMTQPKLFIGDELSLGLAPMIIDDVYDALAAIKKDGTSLLIIEQHVHHALNIADSVVIMAHGRVDFTGSVEGARAHLDQANH